MNFLSLHWKACLRANRTACSSAVQTEQWSVDDEKGLFGAAGDTAASATLSSTFEQLENISI